MGGSSLGPAVLESVLTATGRPGGSGTGRRRLVVCDTTHPATVAGIDFSDAFVLVSSKSGTTLEPNVLLDHAWSRLPDASRYAVITDPGTPLAKLAAERGFARCFENPPDIGGRYSVLSYFGLVPAALIGYDVAELCGRALSAELTEAVGLGMAMAEDARAGRDKVTIVVPDAFASFGLWVEQLVAESTGKRGTGCIPVPTTEPEVGHDRHVVPLHPQQPSRRGRAVLPLRDGRGRRGHVLGIDPFDEPNVAESKRNTLEALAGLPLPEVETADTDGVGVWLEEVVSVRRLRRPPGVSPLRTATTPSRGSAGASATVWAAWPSPPATDPASSTPPASSTRAGPDSWSRSRSSPPPPAPGSPSPDGTTTSPPSSPPRPSATTEPPGPRPPGHPDRMRRPDAVVA